MTPPANKELAELIITLSFIDNHCWSDKDVVLMALHCQSLMRHCGFSSSNPAYGAAVLGLVIFANANPDFFLRAIDVPKGVDPQPIMTGLTAIAGLGLSRFRSIILFTPAPGAS